jgi:hypothetical protein
LTSAIVTVSRFLVGKVLAGKDKPILNVIQFLKTLARGIFLLICLDSHAY